MERIDIDMNITTPKRKVTNQNWAGFAKAIAFPQDPDENSPSAMERLMKKIMPHVVDIKNLRPQFHARNGVQLLEFRTEWERKHYASAWERWMEFCSKADKLDGRVRGYMLFAEMQKFKEAAENCKAEAIAEAMYDARTKYDQSPVAVFCFKQGIARAVKCLIEKYKVKRDEISLIWGGNAAYNQTERIDNAEFIRVFGLMMSGKFDDIPKATIKKIKQQLKSDDAGLGDMSGYNLGSQSRTQRQEEIDRFQSGRSRYCFYTFKSGGVGLSLHHTDELTKHKVRRKDESGYAYEEDIPLVSTRQRVTFLNTTYSAIELVQGLGRAPRLTSLSDTSQVVLFYKGTVEEHVAAIVSMKLKCLKKVVRQKESWEDVILEAAGQSHANSESMAGSIRLLKGADGDEEEDEEEEEAAGLFIEDDELDQNK
jgi:hypothetical protein